LSQFEAWTNRLSLLDRRARAAGDARPRRCTVPVVSERAGAERGPRGPLTGPSSSTIRDRVLSSSQRVDLVDEPERHESDVGGLLASTHHLVTPFSNGGVRRLRRSSVSRRAVDGRVDSTPESRIRRRSGQLVDVSRRRSIDGGSDTDPGDVKGPHESAVDDERLAAERWASSAEREDAAVGASSTRLRRKEDASRGPSRHDGDLSHVEGSTSKVNRSIQRKPFGTNHWQTPPLVSAFGLPRGAGGVAASWRSPETASRELSFSSRSIMRSLQTTGTVLQRMSDAELKERGARIREMSATAPTEGANLWLLTGADQASLYILGTMHAPLLASVHSKRALVE